MSRGLNEFEKLFISNCYLPSGANILLLSLSDTVHYICRVVHHQLL